MEGVLAGRVIERLPAVSVSQGAAAGQHARWRGHLLGGKEMVVVVVVVGRRHRGSVHGQQVGRLVAAEAGGVGGGRGGLAQGQRGARAAQGQGSAAPQGGAPVLRRGGGGQDDRLAALLLEERSGGSLQNEFGALNALVLVTLRGNEMKGGSSKVGEGLGCDGR